MWAYKGALKMSIEKRIKHHAGRILTLADSLNKEAEKRAAAVSGKSDERVEALEMLRDGMGWGTPGQPYADGGFVPPGQPDAILSDGSMVDFKTAENVLDASVILVGRVWLTNIQQAHKDMARQLETALVDRRRVMEERDEAYDEQATTHAELIEAQTEIEALEARNDRQAKTIIEQETKIANQTETLAGFDKRYCSRIQDINALNGKLYDSQSRNVNLQKEMSLMKQQLNINAGLQQRLETQVAKVSELIAINATLESQVKRMVPGHQPTIDGFTLGQWYDAATQRIKQIVELEKQNKQLAEECTRYSENYVPKQAHEVIQGLLKEANRQNGQLNRQLLNGVSKAAYDGVCKLSEGYAARLQKISDAMK